MSIFCFNNQNQIGCVLTDILTFVFTSHVCDDAAYHAPGGYFVCTSVAECGISTAQRGSAAAPALSRDHCLHSNGPTKWHSCPACFTHIPSEVDIKAASLVLSSFGDIETMTPSLLEIASCLCSHSHNVSSFRKYPLL